MPNLCTRFPTAAACHCHGVSSDLYLARVRLIWLQRRDLNSRSLAYETNGDGRSPTLQYLESVRGFEPLSTGMKTQCPEPLDDTDKNWCPRSRLERTAYRLQGDCSTN